MNGRILVALMLMGLTTMNCIKQSNVMNEPYPDLQPIEFFPETPGVQLTGSLYSGENGQANLISDSKAFRINDIVLIRITESTSATNQATTDVERTGSANLKVPNLLGLEKTHTQFFGAGTTDGTLVGASSASTHEGTGTTGRSDVFTGNVAARVIRVLPNGYLILQGHKSIHVNGEKMSIYMTGMVNPLMIDAGHSVPSSAVADLQLRYGGKGIVSAQQNPGLFSRILHAIWPF